MAKLTPNKITGLLKKSSAYYASDDDGSKGMGRLCVKIYPSGSKRFVFRYFVGTKANFILIGNVPNDGGKANDGTDKVQGISLADAREEAKKYGAMLQRGLDPKVEQENINQEKDNKAKLEAQKGSIEQLFASYTTQMEKDGKRTFKAVLGALEKEVYPFIPPATKAKDVTKDNLITILAHMIKRGANTQSNRVRSTGK